MNELDIFSNALEIASADERSQHLDQACGDDVELRKRIDDLLRSHSDVGSFMIAPAPGIGANIDEFGPRFPDMSAPYDARLQALASDAAMARSRLSSTGSNSAVTASMALRRTTAVVAYALW